MFVNSSEIRTEVESTVKALGLSIFSTKDFIDRFSLDHSSVWANIVNVYGKGGKGAGKHYSSYSFISQQLHKMFLRGQLNKLHYEPAPKGYGSPVIRYWTADFDYSSKSDYPDEAETSKTFSEGAKKQVTVNRYERDSSARQACIDYYGASCSVCDRDFASLYGTHGEGFIHVHHLKPISSIGEEYTVNPILDLRPVCPNCHAMIHRGDKMLAIDEARTLWAAAGGKNSN